MSDEQREDEDVESHVLDVHAATEPADEDEDDEVEAHVRMNMRHKSARYE